MKYRVKAKGHISIERATIFLVTTLSWVFFLFVSSCLINKKKCN